MIQRGKIPIMSEESKSESPLSHLNGQPWWVLVILTTISSVATGFFSYQAAVVKSKAKVEENRKTSEAGYEQLVKAVEMLQKHDEDTTKTLAGLSGHIESIESLMRGFRSHVDRSTNETHLEVSFPKGTKNRTQWRPNFPSKVDVPEVKHMMVPQSLDEAAKK